MSTVAGDDGVLGVYNLLDGKLYAKLSAVSFLGFRMKNVLHKIFQVLLMQQDRIHLKKFFHFIVYANILYTHGEA